MGRTRLQQRSLKRREVLARAILTASFRKGAFDIADGNPITRKRLASREYHHVFPDHLLREEAGLLDRESSRALNCVLITMSTNRNISSKDPLKYLGERIDRADLGEQVVRDRLHSHLVPFEELQVGGYADVPAPGRAGRIRADYEAFLARRADMIGEAFRALTSGRNWPAES